MNPIELCGAYSDGVYALLRVVADPVVHKQRLGELIAQENATKEQIAALNEMAASTRRQNSAAEALTIVLNKRKAALDAREAELDDKAKGLDQVEAKRSDAAMRLRENAVQAQENVNKREAVRLAAIRADYEGKLGKIKNLAGAL
jgi:endo-alpha-1,4-polygalactosaminidase (GH114 family)